MLTEVKSVKDFEIKGDAEDSKDISALAGEIADMIKDNGAIGGTLTFDYPEEHHLFGFDVTLTVRASDELEDDDGEEEDLEDEEDEPRKMVARKIA